MNKFRKFFLHINANLRTFLLVIFVPPCAFCAFLLFFEGTLFPFHIEESYIRIYPKKTYEICEKNHMVEDSILRIRHDNQVFALKMENNENKTYYEGSLTDLVWKYNIDSIYTQLRTSFPNSRITILTPKGLAQFYSVNSNSHNETTLYYPLLWIIDKYDYVIGDMFPIIVILLYVLPLSIYVVLLILKKVLRVHDGDKQSD